MSQEVTVDAIGLIRIPGLAWDECFFRAKARLMRGKINLTQLEKYGEIHLDLQYLTAKSWLSIIAVPMGAPTALKNRKTI